MSEKPIKPACSKYEESDQLFLESYEKTYIDVAPGLMLIKTGQEHKGLRFNNGKTRHDLVPQFAQQQYAKVLTKGSEKYADRTWELGMSWSNVIASLKRHLEAFEMGEDYDKETGLLHTAHIMCNAAFLTEYYKIYPQGDNRPHRYLNTPRIGLDIDEVLADFVGAMLERFPNMKERSVYWNDPHIMDNFDAIKDDEGFWMAIKPKNKNLPFEPHCYITSRPIPTIITENWLKLNGFPAAPVYSVEHGKSKVDIAKQSKLEIFVDDRYENFVDLNKNGVCCFLFDAPHNQRYNVGYKRIKSLDELVS